MKIAIVSDPLTEFGGEQRVLEVLHEMFPRAPVYTGMLDLANMPQRFASWDIRVPHPRLSAFLKKTKLRSLRLALIFVYQRLDLSRYDLVISSGTFFAKAVRAKKHLAYIHTPPRFLYGFETSGGMRQKPLLRLFLAPLDHILRLWDYTVVRNVRFLVCNSETVRSRIKKFYAREAVIVHPPVGLGKYISQPTGDYFLVVSRLERYKNVDLAIQACNLIGCHLIVAGKGLEEKYLKSIAGQTVEFLGFVGDEGLGKLFARAKAFIFPIKDEDFGITPVEAQSFGCPVVAHRSGGALETVIEGKTGEFFNELTPESLAETLKNFNPAKYKESDLTGNAGRFSKEVFIKKMKAIIAKTYA